MRTNAGDLAKLNRKRARRLVRYCTEALETSENRIHKAAQDLSLGTTSTKTLSAPPPGLNHPYGYGKFNSRGPRGPILNGGNRAVINAQSGIFAASWDANGFITVQRMVVVLINTAPYAPNMLGTHLMVHRPILEAVHAREDRAFFNRFREAQRRAYST